MGILEVAIASWVAKRQPKMTADEFYRLDTRDPLPRVVIAVLLCVAVIGGLQMLQASAADPQIDADRGVVKID